MNLQMERTRHTYCRRSVTITQLTGRKYTSGKALHLLAIMTLHRNIAKKNDSIIEN
jgi:hypothetical protein